MSQGRRSGDVGESLSLQASSPREAETLDAAVASLAALDAHQLRLQWRNHLGGAAPTHLPRWLLLRVLAYPGLSGDYRHDPRVVGKMAASIVLPWSHRAFSLLKRWALGTYRDIVNRDASSSSGGSERSTTYRSP
jgi:hypothetical protein